MRASSGLPDSLDCFRLDHKVAVITGGAGILGASHCRMFASAGAHVLIADRKAEKCAGLAAEISAWGGKASSEPVNLSSHADVQRWASTILKKYGAPHVLMNNAGYKSENFFNSLETFSWKEWNEVMAVNVTSIFLTAKALGTAMARQGRGSIINIGSIYGILGPDQRIYKNASISRKNINTPLVYSTSKGAVNAATRYLATLWGPSGVRTNTLMPGGVFSGQNASFRAKYENRVPLHKMGRPDEISKAALFLASDASSYINGHGLVVDGGFSIW